MGKLILCSGELAKIPYHFRLTKTNVYSMEEVCYYISHNIYMMQEEIFDREFVLWIRNELKMKKTADKLEDLISDRHNIKDIVVTIFCSCDYYDESEIGQMLRILDEIEKLPKYARRKKKGDNFLQCHSYEKAIEEYEKIFDSDEVLQTEAKAYGDLFHNMGVAYVNIGEFHKASELFLKAYEKNGREESLSQCMYALRFCKDVANYKKLVNDLKISEELQNKWENEFKAALDAGAKTEAALQMEKLNGLVQRGAVEEYYDRVHDYIAAWKEEYRRQISV
ncbi:MAG: hypothetical protein IJ733_08960 [Lachnospiraceae bacterium]|nr:hypothetical protein [Lachnospiraceae bacterium]